MTPKPNKVLCPCPQNEKKRELSYKASYHLKNQKDAKDQPSLKPKVIIAQCTSRESNPGLYRGRPVRPPCNHPGKDKTEPSNDPLQHRTHPKMIVAVNHAPIARSWFINQVWGQSP
ncbi:unnamed protein product [Microthlaspi erraticum]|uniref:Uncharacterized protein n=1 Tax=Microthlaspi erraticum TaxID=1685480 RepID=A0A6D2HPX9_9BRAS|nr:unnamed protein product [Microthlaspi erraticum]